MSSPVTLFTTSEVTRITIKFIDVFCQTTNVVNVDLAELNLYNPDCKDMSEDEKNKSFDNFNLILKNLYDNLS